MSNLPPRSLNAYPSKVRGDYARVGDTAESSALSYASAAAKEVKPVDVIKKSTALDTSKADIKELADVPTHSKVIVHTFKWAAASAGFEGVPVEPVEWSIAPADFKAAFGKRADGSDVVDLELPLFMSKVQIVEYDKRTDAQLSLAMHGIQGRTLAEEGKNDATTTTFSMIGPSGHQTKVGQTVYQLQDNPRRLRQHGTVNLEKEVDDIIMPDDVSFMFVKVKSKAGEICSSAKFKRQLAPRDSEGKLIGPGVVHVDQSLTNYYKVDSKSGMETLKSYSEKVLKRRPFTVIGEHKSTITRFDRSGLSTNPKSFADISDVAGSRRELDKSANDLQSLTVKVRYTILDQRALAE